MKKGERENGRIKIQGAAPQLTPVLYINALFYK
jgi:hypothetical protein